MAGPFESYAGLSQDANAISGVGHAIAEQIQMAHARDLGHELAARDALTKQFEAIEQDPSYDPQARNEARDHAFALKFLKPTDKRPKQYQYDKDGRIPALVGVTYRKAMRDGPQQPAEPAAPADPSVGLAPPPDVGVSGAGGSSGGSPAPADAGAIPGGTSIPPTPGGSQPTPGKISPAPAIAGPPITGAGGPPPVAGLTPPPSIGPPPVVAGASAGSSDIGPPDASSVSTRRGGIEMAQIAATQKAIEGMIPISKGEADTMGLPNDLPAWPGMPGMVAVHPKVLENTRFALDRNARLTAQGFDADGNRLPWKVQHDDATLGLQNAQAEAQRMIAANKPKEAAALLIGANAKMIEANAAMKRAQYNPYVFMFGGAAGGGMAPGAGGAGGSGGPGGGGSAGGSGGPADHSDDHNVKTTVSGKEYVDLTGYTGQMAQAMRVKYTNMDIPVLDGKEADAVRQIDAARLDQSSIAQQLWSLLPKDAGGRVLGGPSNKLSAVLQTDDQIAAFNSWRGAAIRSLRATAGSEGLRMNEQEILLAVANDLPQLTDTVGVAQQKAANILIQLDNIESAHLVPRRGGMAGSTGSADKTALGTGQTVTPPPATTTKPAETNALPPPPDKRVVGKTTWTDQKGVLRVWNGVGWARASTQPQPQAK